MSDTGENRSYLFERSLLSLDQVEAQRILSGSIRRDGALPALETVLVPALERIGAAWDSGMIALSQYYMAGRICESLVRNALPAETPASAEQPVVGIATLEDHHLLGKRIVLAALRASGFAVTDLGRGSVEEIAERVIGERVEVLLVSTLMLPAALRVGALREKIVAAGDRPTVIVGGAPFRLDPALWSEVGADATGSNASDAVVLVRDACRRWRCATP